MKKPQIILLEVERPNGLKGVYSCKLYASGRYAATVTLVAKVTIYVGLKLKHIYASGSQAAIITL